ncbi:MAG: hypothetical protein GX933_00600 [Chloroflexi bacterium]|nr:hypothetical protein [Chloroflexota bacterium]
MNNNRQTIFATISSVAAFIGLNFIVEWPIIIAALLSIGIFAGVYMISKPKLKIGNLDLDSLKNGTEIRFLLQEAEQDLISIGEVSKKIDNPVIKTNAESLFDTGVRILNYLSENPDQISAARRFFGYYLNTSRNILEKYLTVQKAKLNSAEINNIKAATEKTIPMLNIAFDRQFENLMKNDILDIESEIKLLETNLKMEGIEKT